MGNYQDGPRIHKRYRHAIFSQDLFNFGNGRGRDDLHDSMISMDRRGNYRDTY